MSIAAVDLRNKAEARMADEYVIQQRRERIETNSERMTRLDEVTRLYRHDWSFLSPGGKSTTQRPKVMNQVQVELDDIARLVSETQPSIRIPAKGDTKVAETAAAVREAIAYGYWTYNRAERLVPITAMDLAGAGAAFWVPFVQPAFAYPALMRLNPRSCYPTILNGELTDLMHITEMKHAQLTMLKGIELPGVRPEDKVELIGFYDDLEWGELAYGGGQKSRWVTPPTRHGLRQAGRGMVPVAFAQLDTFDSAMRGMFDGMGGTLEAKNRIAELILDNADQMVYSPIVQYEVENPGDFGPLAIINLQGEKSSYGRAEVPQVSPQLFGLLQMLEGESRAAGGYPPQRQGEQVGSIISGAGVSSTMGMLTSAVRNISRLQGMMREQANRLMFALDESDERLNVEKPLCRTVGGKKKYTPSEDINGEYENEVIYGAGAGLDKANQTVLALQLKGAGLVSDETIMGELSEVSDPIGEKERIVREQMESALLQKFAAEAPLAMTMQAVALMGKGKSLLEVAEELLPQAQAQQQAEQQAQQGAQGAPQDQGQMTPEQVQAQQTSMEKGGVPGQAPAQSGEVAPETFNPPSNLFVNAGR